MGDLHLFNISKGSIEELKGASVELEKSLQTLIERNLEDFFSIRFLASEHPTGKSHRGRIDTIGIDENGYPVIIEYKKAMNENVINQGLFYLDWLLDHKGEFELLVMRTLGKEIANKIEWGSPRLLCIAGGFNKYDEHAVQQIKRNIELIRYRKYGEDLLLFELVNAPEMVQPPDGGGRKGTAPSITEVIDKIDGALLDRFVAIRSFLLALGDDVQLNTLKFYLAFKRIRNFACLEIRPKAKTIIIYVKIKPDSIDLKPGFTRDVREKGHYGTGDLEITISTDADFEMAKPLLIKSYDAS